MSPPESEFPPKWKELEELPFEGMVLNSCCFGEDPTEMMLPEKINKHIYNNGWWVLVPYRSPRLLEICFHQTRNYNPFHADVFALGVTIFMLCDKVLKFFITHKYPSYKRTILKKK